MWAGGTPSCFLPADGAVVPAAETTAAAGTAHEQRPAGPRPGCSRSWGTPGRSGDLCLASDGRASGGPRARAVGGGAVCEPGPQPAGCLAWPPEAGNG